jgi:hypothetical protein
VERPGVSDPVVVNVNVESPTAYEWTVIFGGSMASDAMGVAYEVSRKVRAVVPGSPAATAGFQPGDLITSMELAWRDPQPNREARRSHGVPVEFDDHQYSWPLCFYRMQQMVADEVLKLTYERAGVRASVALAPVEIDAFNPDRGLIFEGRSEIHKAANWAEAILLGCRQTWRTRSRLPRFSRSSSPGVYRSPTSVVSVRSLTSPGARPPRGRPNC